MGDGAAAGGQVPRPASLPPDPLVARPPPRLARRAWLEVTAGVTSGAARIRSASEAIAWKADLAKRMWTPAASALRRHPGPGMPPPLRSRLVAVHNKAEHQMSGIPKSAAHDVSLSEEMCKAVMALREHSLELDNIHAEMRCVMKRCVAAVVGLPLLAWVLKTY